MTECTNCRGTGLAGSGDQPWMHLGAVKTCESCTGTGQMPEEVETVVEEAPAEVPVVMSEETPTEPAEETAPEVEVVPEVTPEA